MMRENLYGSQLKNIPHRLTLISEDDADFIRQAAKATGFDVRVEPAPDSEWAHLPLAVVTYDERKEHGPFWRKYEQLKADAEERADASS